MKLLVIEDNRGIARHIKSQFTKMYIVDVVHCGKEGVCRAISAEYDLIVLDLGLPDVSGVQVCRMIRDAGIQTPILVLTGRSETVLKVSLLESGADDYLTKPFHTEELVARVRAILRRKNRRFKEEVLQQYDLTLNRETREVFRGETRIVLRRKEFDILEYLLQHKGRALSRETIIRYAWRGDVDCWHNTVDVHIKRLRDKLDREFSPPIIKTEHGVGYMVDDSV